MAATSLKIYLAAPLFNDMERRFNLELATELEKLGRVFLPQRDGGLMMELVKNGTAPGEAAKIVFAKDRQAMEQADLLVAVLDGAKIDEGVAFEIGFMFNAGKYCIGLQTDMRRALPTGNNPMIEASLALVFDNQNMLVSGVKNYCQRRDESNPDYTSFNNDFLPPITSKNRRTPNFLKRSRQAII